MIFTSFEFALFFVAVLLIRGVFTTLQGEKLFLVFASYVFYMSWNVYYAGLIFSASCCDYILGNRIAGANTTGERRAFLVASLVMNLGILTYFKYSPFIIETTASLLSLIGISFAQHHWNVILPVGISFFTFQSLSYTIDVYRRKITPCSTLRDFLLFVAFFPQLVAGPIVRATEFLPQLVTRARANAREIETGLALIALGVVKKSVISDQVSSHVDVIFANPQGFDAPTLLLGVLGYAVQIYCDFSGYSDIAIGCARVMGYRFPENFQMPYSAVNITDFWRRWHISLSSWLRDYLYIPLGGNRHGVSRYYVSLMLTMLLGGLWHGASWNFVIWGGIHGVALIAHKIWSGWRISRDLSSPSWWRLLASRGLTMGVVLIGWIFFRARTFSDASELLLGLLRWESGSAQLLSPQILASVAIVFVMHIAFLNNRNWADEIVDKTLSIRIATYTTLLTTIVSFGSTDASPFIYFQF